MSKTSKNILISIICIICSVIFLMAIIPSQVPLPKFSSGGTTPRAIPKVCCVLTIVMSCMILWRSFFVEKGSLGELKKELTASLKDQKGWKTFAGVMALFAVSVCYYIGYCTAGFFLTTIVLFPVYAFVLGCKRIISIVITDVVLAFSIYYFFAVCMGCYLPGWAPF